MMWYHDGPGWGGWLVMTLMMLVFWGALVLAAIALWRAARRDGDARHQDERPDPQRLLDERFARGEIDEDDYTRRRELLRTGH